MGGLRCVVYLSLVQIAFTQGLKNQNQQNWMNFVNQNAQLSLNPVLTRGLGTGTPIFNQIGMGNVPGNIPNGISNVNLVNSMLSNPYATRTNFNCANMVSKNVNSNGGFMNNLANFYSKMPLSLQDITKSSAIIGSLGGTNTLNSLQNVAIQNLLNANLMNVDSVQPGSANIEGKQLVPLYEAKSNIVTATNTPDSINHLYNANFPSVLALKSSAIAGNPPNSNILNSLQNVAAHNLINTNLVNMDAAQFGQSNLIQTTNFPDHLNHLYNSNVPLAIRDLPNQPFGLHVLADGLNIGGTVSIAGNMPIYGSVALSGNLPTDGSAIVNYGCS
ncbi:uncharacterized protein LOC101736796 [Bombyx mori]|uniref:Uncharacterized protein n=2 Tax=Bombyx mori TaxID=7091 RepID=A0A8R2AGG5_BOMMO|nr:uncharacterized protein LOC101736796 isoform X1 [Bombyx mori]